MPPHPTFAETAKHLCGYHPPKDALTVVDLGTIRDAFETLIETVEPIVPEGPDATVAARSIHRACQDVIAAVILNQEATP